MENENQAKICHGAIVPYLQIGELAITAFPSPVEVAESEFNLTYIDVDISKEIDGRIKNIYALECIERKALVKRLKRNSVADAFPGLEKVLEKKDLDLLESVKRDIFNYFRDLVSIYNCEDIKA
jgi:hypothetical protein